MSNHDEHYAARRDELETIKVQERLIVHGIPEEYHEQVIRNFNIATAYKYQDRQGDKDDWSKEIEKAINYLTRALTGKWIEKAECVKDCPPLEPGDIVVGDTPPPGPELTVSEDENMATYGDTRLVAESCATGSLCRGCFFNERGRCTIYRAKKCGRADREDRRDIIWVRQNA